MKTRYFAAGLLLTAGAAVAQDAPLFQRPFDGVPTARHEGFTRIVPHVATERGTRNFDPANMPSRFSESETAPAEMGMTGGFAYLGQFIDHDITLILEDEAGFLLPPFVKAAAVEDGEFINLRSPGLDLDSVYGFGPFEGVSASEGWYDLDTGVGLRFVFGEGPSGAVDHHRNDTGRALIGDHRNDENGMVGQIHRAFMQLHNKTVDKILTRESIDEMTLTPGSAQWWDVFNEARNFTTAYYQGIVANDFVPRLTGRTLFDAMLDETEPLGPLPEGPQIPLEFGQGLYRLHTIVPNAIQIGSKDFVSPIDPILRSTVHWGYLFGPRAIPASRVDTAVPAELRNIIDLVIPGVGSATLDLGRINVMRGRETELPSGEEYLYFLKDELGLNPRSETIRGKQILNWSSGSLMFTNPDDVSMMDDLLAEDTDLWAYCMAEADLNEGLLGPVGQDIIERTFANLMWDDPYSLVGANSNQFTNAQLDVFMNATMDGLLSMIYTPGDINNDDTVDSDDLASLLALWGTDDLASDLNGDGAITSQDLAMLLANWGQ